MTAGNSFAQGLVNGAMAGGDGGTRAPAPLSADQQASEMIQRGEHDVNQYAALVREHPQVRERVLTMLHTRFGNAFVSQVLDAVERKADRFSHREGLMQGIGMIQTAIFSAVDRGIDQAQMMIQATATPKHSERGWLQRLLVYAAGSALYGVSGGIGVWLAGALSSATGPAQKVVEDALKDAIRRSYASGESSGDIDLQNLKSAFLKTLRFANTTAQGRYVAAWSSYHDQLSVLSEAELEQAHVLAMAALQRDPTVIVDDMIDKAIIGWTNFLAQMTHGTMGGWDTEQRHGSKGAVPLRDSEPKPERPGQDPTGANVDPRRLDRALELGQIDPDSKESGVLQIFVDGMGRLVEQPNYGMRLDDAGPQVKQHLLKRGRVGALPVNKIVRICDVRTTPLTVIGNLVITADGYVRVINVPGNQMIHVSHKAVVGPAQIGETRDCLTDLIHGNSSMDCYRDTSQEQLAISGIAERVQALSLDRISP